MNQLHDTMNKIIQMTGAKLKPNGEYNGACPLCEPGAKGHHLYFKLDNNKIIMNCQKCNGSFSDFCKALNLEQKECFDNPEPVRPTSNTREHIYIDIDGRKTRKTISKDATGSKTVYWNRYENGQWISGLDGYKPSIYHLKSVLNEHRTVYIVEGEKDVETMEKMGFVATTSPNGASQTGTKWNIANNQYFKNKNVILLADNDEPGQNYVNDIAKNLFNIAKSILVLNTSQIYPGIDDKGDISDVTEILGTEKTKKLIIDTVHKERIKKWLLFTTQTNGKEKREIHEPEFLRYFLINHNYFLVNGKWYSEDGEVPASRIKTEIQKEIEPYFTKGIANKTNGLYDALCNKCAIEPGEPPENKIYCKGETLIISEDGEITEDKTDTDFTFNRFNATYRPDAPEPKQWIEFLSSLLHKEDITTLQEYMGYCLIPTTQAQKCLFIVGKGGEGKSRIGVILQEIFKNSMISDKIHRLEDDKFLLAKLQNRLLFYDDDLNAKKMTETGTFKGLVTNEITVQAEIKGKDKFDLKPYTRFISCGNQALSSCFDRSDGFYRRLIILSCLPKFRTIDDRFYSDKLLKEKDLIFMWAIRGLQHLIKNNFNFSISKYATENLDDLEKNENNILHYLNDAEIFETTKSPDDGISSTELYYIYCHWCDINSYEPLAKRTFDTTLKDKQEEFLIVYNKNVRYNGTKVRGYKNIKFTPYALNVIANKERYDEIRTFKKKR